MQVVQWSVPGGSCPVGLSVTGNPFNVVVCCCDSPSLRMYTPLGCPVCEISCVQQPLVGLVHAVQLSDCSQFLVIGVKENGDKLVCVYRNNEHLQG